MYDVDVVVSLNLLGFDKETAGLPNAKMVIDWLAGRFSEYPAYTSKVEIKNRCVRLKYSDGFCMDIVPVHCSGDVDAPLHIPRDWKLTHPKGFKAYCVGRQEETNKTFYAVVKMLKWWRNIHFGDDGSPKSILLTTLIGQQISENAGFLDEALVSTMEALVEYFAPKTTVPDVFNPSLQSEKLSGSWELSEYWDFKAKLSCATKLARKALDEKDEGESIKLWNDPQLFDGTFPKALYGLEAEAKNAAESMRTGNLFTSSVGMISPSVTPRSIRVPPTKYFGD